MAVTAQINLEALRHNLSVVRRHAPQAQVMAMIKANGYGHGLLSCAQALVDADILGVARIDEALSLRASGITQRIINMNGFADKAAFDQLTQAQVEVCIHTEHQLATLLCAEQYPLAIWIKVDSGMHRAGFALSEIPAIAQRLAAKHDLNKVTWMTHFACADEQKNNRTMQAMSAFNQSLIEISGQRSLANSAAVLSLPESHADCVRPGIMLYGISPFANSVGNEYHLQPVMRLTAPIIAIKDLKQGDAIGYGATYVCSQAMRVALVAIGYGDGYPRHAPSGTPIMVQGKPSQLLGRVSMDLITIDLRGIDAAIGDEVLLWGAELPVETIATKAGTIAYELLAGLTSRVQYVTA